MSDYSALDLSESAIPTPLSRSFLSQVRAFLTGAIVAAAIAALGGVLVTVVLTVGMVASPIWFAVVLYFVVRRRRSERLRWTAPQAT